MILEVLMPNVKECCALFDPKPWHESRHIWKDKLFLYDTIPQLFHIPLPGTLGGTIKRMWENATRNKIETDIKNFLLLAHDPSPWKSELYLSVAKECTGLEIVKISGCFITMVFDGPYSAVPVFIKEMDRYLSGIKEKAEKYFFYFTTCPKCARKFGHNYIVAFAKVVEK